MTVIRGHVGINNIYEVYFTVVHLLVYYINLNITLMQQYEHTKVLFFHSSLPSLVMCVMVLRHSNVLHMTICTCVVFQGLLYNSVSADITETICFYQGHTLVLTPVQLTPHYIHRVFFLVLVVSNSKKCMSGIYITGNLCLLDSILCLHLVQHLI